MNICKDLRIETGAKISTTKVYAKYFFKYGIKCFKISESKEIRVIREWGTWYFRKKWSGKVSLITV